MSTSEVEDRILSVGDIAGLPVFNPSHIDWFNALVYSLSGVGKTLLWSSAAAIQELCPVLLIDVEQGSTSTRRFPHLNIVRPTNFEQIAQVYKKLKEQQNNGGIEYKTVILDSLTETQRLNTENVMGRTVKAARDKGDTKDPDHPDWGDWTKSHNQFRKMVRAYRDLECNTLFTALAQVDMSRPSKPMAKPRLNGVMADEIAASLDVVLFLEKREVDGQTVRIAVADSTEDIVAKDRFAVLGEELVNPTFTDIWTKINEQ